MKTLLTACLILPLLGSPALAAPAAEDPHLHLVRTERDVLVRRDVVVIPGRRRRDPRVRVEQIVPGKALDLYIAQGPYRLGEQQFLDLIARSGADPALVERVAATDRAALWHGGLTIVALVGSAVAGAIAEIQFGPDPALVASAGPNRLVINTAEITAVALAVGGVVTGLLWLNDTRAKGAPYFHAFSAGDAEAAIDAYNRKLDAERPLKTL
ncbi:MAG: hypothetical protein JWM80_700 [Cyanobacteria bacterium RYN_339]|nr:hypothetical protein [Cyanobacteria bacterium RYN_339]